MIVKEEQKGMWKRTVGLFTKFHVPWHLYLLQVVLGIISAKVMLLYIPYSTKLQTGNITDNAVLWGYLGFASLSSVVSVVENIPKFFASAMVTRNLQNKMIGRALHLPMKSYEKNASKIVSWVTQDCTYADGLISVVVYFFTGMAATYMSVTSMSAIDKSLLFLVPIVVVYIIFSTWLKGKFLFLRERRGRRANSELTAYMAEHLGYFRQIKQMHTQKHEAVLGKTAIDEFYHADIYKSWLTFLIGFVAGSINNIITILVFAFGAIQVRSGAISIDELAAFQAYISMAYQSLSSLPDLYSSLMYYNGTLFYIANLMSEKEEEYKRTMGMDRSDEDVSFENVSFSYDKNPIIHNVSFTIPKGKVTMVIGSNGSGKTTLFKLIERFYQPRSGSIRFGDTDVENIHLGQWRQSFGYVLQEPQLFDGTIWDNIVYGLDRNVTDEEVRTVARLACADDFIMELPEGYKYDIGENGENLSAGQRQRLAIARALLLDPAYILLDEATCNMDAHSENIVNDTLFNVMKGRTIIMISHDMRMLKRADQVIVLKDGGIEAWGPVEEVEKTSTTLQKLISAEA